MESSRNSHIAVIGAAGRVPGANDLEEFWQNLVSEVESVTFFEEDELRQAGVTEEDLADPNYVRASPLLQGSDMFDPGYFGMTLREAEVLDPQHRVFLEVCETTLQHGGYDPWRYPSRIGVYGGVGPNNYFDLHVRPNKEAAKVIGGLTGYLSNLSDYVATGVSFRLNLRGPALTCLTACSTSLVAVHLACQALLNGECEMALAGGIEEFFPRISGYTYAEGAMFSPDGHCRAFDASARGTIFGSGAGAVLLKPLGAAIADGDNVLGVILGTAINNDGDDKAGFTAPSVSGQTAAIRSALAAAQVDPTSVSYVEAHGTGTFVGDPIEVAALTNGYGRDTDRTQWCGVGSVKPNVGHLGAAAGVTSLLKVLLALRHGVLPATINFEAPNPQIDFPSSPFRVIDELTPWPRNGTPRRAGISSMGVGGTNAHLVIEEPPEPISSSVPARPQQLLLLSARTPTALEATATRLGGGLGEAEPELADAAYTLATGRPLRQVRGFVVGERTDELAQRLSAGIPMPAPEIVAPQGVVRRVAFMFPGQGSQYAHMTRDLYASEAVFRDELDACAEALVDHIAWDLREFIDTDDPDAADQLAQTARTQPTLFAVEYALARQLQSWGVEPDGMIGHSIGELVAACVAGVFSRDDALRLVAARGALMQDLPRGSMLTVPLAEEQLAEHVGGDVTIAAVNAPDLCVVSGPDDAVDQLERMLSVQGVVGTRLRTSHAFHSAMMDPILDEFTAQVRAVTRRAPGIPFLSNLTGRWITDDEATDPSYWARHLREAVRFGDSLPTLIDGSRWVMVEVGPGQVLTTLARRQLPTGMRSLAVPTVRHPKQRQSDVTVLVNAVGQIWQAGADVDVARLWSGESRQRVELPPVAYDRVHCWLDAPADATTATTADAGVDEVGPYYLPAWMEQTLDDDAPIDADATWLVFTSDRPVCTALVARLRDAGARVITVAAGDEAAWVGDAALTVRPGERADYGFVLDEVLATPCERLKVVHSWLVGALPGATPMERASAGLQLGFRSILDVVQAISRNPASPPVDMYLLTGDLQSVSGEERIEPTKAGVLGFVKLLPKELSDTTCRAIDIRSDDRHELQVTQILRELASASTEEQVAYRGRKRWVWRHQEVRLNHDDGMQELLPDGAVVLITGGLGGVGLVTAKDLAEHRGARLVLVGRSGLPPRDSWEQILAQSEADERTAQQIRAVLEMEELGSEVLTCAADVTDVEQMRAVRAAAEKRFGRVGVVLHAAGVTGGGMIETRTADEVASVMAPKVFGPLVLEEVFGDDLDLLLLYSTFAIFTGDFGLGDYVAANAIMDAWAQSRDGGRTHVATINWPIWKGLGMADKVDAPDLLLDYEMGDRYEASDHPLLGSRLLRSGNSNVIFVKSLRTEHWVPREHRLGGRPTMPAVSLVEMMRAGFEEATGTSAVELRDVVFLRPLTFDHARNVHVLLEPQSSGRYAVMIRDADDGSAEVQVYATGTVGPATDEPAPVHDVDAWRARCSKAEGAFEVVAGTVGAITLGPHWNVIRGSWRTDTRDDGTFDELVRLELDEEFTDEVSRYGLHPSLFDCATSIGQTIIRAEGTSLPFEYDRIVVRAPLPARCYSYIRHLDDATGSLVRTNITITDEHGAEVVDVQGYSLLDAAALEAVGDRPTGAAAASNPALDEASIGAEFNMLRDAVRDFGIGVDDGYTYLSDMIDARVAPQIIVCPDSFTRRLAYAREVTRDALREQLAAAPQRTASASPRNLATPYVEPQTEVQQVLCGMWEETLAVDKVGIDDDFFDLNGNSLIAVQMVTRIREQFQVELTVATLFESRSVRSLGAAIDVQLIALVESLSDDEALERLSAG